MSILGDTSKPGEEEVHGAESGEALSLTSHRQARTISSISTIESGYLRLVRAFALT